MTSHRWWKSKIQGKMKNLIFLLIFIFSFLTLSAYAQKSNTLKIPLADLEEGIVLEVEGASFFLQDKNKKVGDTFEVRPKESLPPLKIEVLPNLPEDGSPLLIPVVITDTELAKGAEITLRLKEGESKVIKIPRRRVIIPTKFYLVFPELGERGRYGGKAGLLIIEVYPKMTLNFKVDVEDTAEEGVVVRAEYEDNVKAKITDILNKTGQRDLSMQGFIRQGEEQKWGINLENLMQTQNPRKIDLSRRQKLRERLFLDARIDNLQDKKGLHLGGNLIYFRQNKEFNFGNVDKKVSDEAHLQMKTSEKYGDTIFRLQGFKGQKEEGYHTPGLFIEKFGAQINLRDLWGGLNLQVGTLKIEKVENYLETGQCDDKINFVLDYSRQMGTPYRSWETKKVSWGGEAGVKFMGIGKDIWLRGRWELNLNLKPNTSLQFALNDDFISLSGKEEHAPWQNRRITLIHYKKLWEDRTILGKLDLEYVFAETKWRRSDYSTSFSQCAKHRFGFGKNIEVLGFAAPLEFFGERDSRGVYQYGVTVSIRQWM